MSAFEQPVRNRLGRLAITASLTVFSVGTAHAVTYNEIGASLRFESGAGPEVVGPGVDRIEGIISGGDEGDLFRVTFSTAGVLTIRALGLSGSLNPSLYLFDAAGSGLRADDNSFTLLNSQIVISITPGTYYIGIGDEPLVAVDTDGSTWASTLVVDSPPPAAFGTLDRLRQDGVIVSPGDYAITLSIPTASVSVDAVPEPTTPLLLAAGLLALGSLNAAKARVARPAATQR